MRLYILIITFLTLLSCKTRKPEEASGTKFFFENSRRRSATEKESESVVQFMVDGQQACAGFAIESRRDRHLIVTARHCAKDNVQGWCQGGGHFKSMTGKASKCIGVIFESKSQDIAVVEVAEKLSERGLNVALFKPKTGTRVITMGFPEDHFSKVMGYQYPILTENCWVNSDREHNREMPVGIMKSLFHNCTNFSGNSGGPMVIEGTNVAIGIPYNGIRSYTNQSWKEPQAEMVPLYEVFLENSKLVEELGIKTISETPKPVLPKHYFTVSTCASRSAAAEIDWVVPVFLSTEALFALDIKWSNLSEPLRFQCSDSFCRSDDGGQIKVIDQYNLEYRASSPEPIHYKCTPTMPPK